MSLLIYYIFRSRDDLAGDLQADMFSSPPEDQWFSKEKLYKVDYQVFWPASLTLVEIIIISVISAPPSYQKEKSYLYNGSWSRLILSIYIQYTVAV